MELWKIFGIIAIALYILYITIIQKKNKVKEAMSGIDIQLKKRYDLIPNLLSMAQKYMEHEKELMTEIVRLRSEAMKKSFNGSPKEMMELNNMIDAKMKDFWLSVENYPDLKSDQTMMHAMQSFSEVEEHIAAARRFYNASVNSLKNAVEIFPGNIIASMLGIKADMPFYEAENAAKERVDAKEFFK